jgi:hypothetical protein
VKVAFCTPDWLFPEMVTSVVPLELTDDVTPSVEAFPVKMDVRAEYDPTIPLIAWPNTEPRELRPLEISVSTA